MEVDTCDEIERNAHREKSVGHARMTLSRRTSEDTFVVHPQILFSVLPKPAQQTKRECSKQYPQTELLGETGKCYWRYWEVPVPEMTFSFLVKNTWHVQKTAPHTGTRTEHRCRTQKKSTRSGRLFSVSRSESTFSGCAEETVSLPTVDTCDGNSEKPAGAKITARNQPVRK
ncbi:MAG: uncharacterized protein A8A55_3294 [Amphiamblys sp. WSBS2006]|nr:MAG: uncharacterized protein A8A55_3294 [Amphiamblys sp. WSBS2006]